MSAKRGHPLLLASALDKEVQEYVISLWKAGAIVNSAIEWQMLMELLQIMTATY